MESPFRVTRSTSLRAPGLLGALALLGCADHSSLSIPGSHTIAAPVQMGGLPPVEGAELLDSSFASAGVFESSAFVERQPIRVLVDRLGRPLVIGIGAQPSGLLVLRLTEAGTSDASFGTGGAFLLPNDPTDLVTYTPRAADGLIDALDRILLFSTRTLAGGERRAVVVRLDPNGVPDASFGALGRLVLDPTSGAFETLAVSLLADAHGGFVACANELVLEKPHMIVARFDENGALDPDFGEGGVARGPESEASLGVRAALDVAGRIVVAGTLTSEPARVALWRFDAQGALDPSFGVDGLATASDTDAGIGVSASDAATDAAGRIVLLGQRSHDLAEIEDWPNELLDFQTNRAPLFDAIVWRFLPDGTPDAGFADGGSRTLAFNSGPYVSASSGLTGGDHLDAAAGLLLDDAGRIVIAGWSDPPDWNTVLGWATFGPTRPFLVRLTPGGALDVDFHTIGHAQLGWDAHTLATTFPQGHLTSVARDATGRWVLGGGSANGSSQRVWRIVP